MQNLEISYNKILSYKEAQQLEKQNFETEFSSCAVGGVFSHQPGNMDLIFEFMEKLPHRGGRIFVNYNGEIISAGDGAGVQVSIDWEYYNQILFQEGIEIKNLCGIGNFFLPVEEIARQSSKNQIQQILSQNNLRILLKDNIPYWRQIPFDSGESDNTKQLKLQVFQQCFICPNENINSKIFEEKLLISYFQIEEYAHDLNVQYVKQNKLKPNLAVASISCQKIIYKGMLLPHEVKYFTDLKNVKPTQILYHIRQSTNTSPSPGNSQPFYLIGHNGELNSVNGNAYKNHRPKMGYSDSRTFDEHLRMMILDGKNIIEALTLLMPPPNTGNMEIDEMFEDIRSLGLEYNGPAHIMFTDGNIQGAKLDSCALRPSRYLITIDQYGSESLYIGSEDLISASQIPENCKVVERGILKAGQMIIMKDGKIQKFDQIINELRQNYKISCKNVTKIQRKKVLLNEVEIQNGEMELEIRKYQMLPLLEGSIKKIAMGDDTNPIKMDDREYLVVSDHFKQKFAQVTSPSLDSEKESDSLYISTYLGNKEDKDKNNQIKQLYKLESPILKLGELESMKELIGDKIAEMDITVDLLKINSDLLKEENQLLKFLRQRIRELCLEAEQYILAGKSIIILCQKRVQKNRIPLSDILVTAAIFSYLYKNKLERRASLVVNSVKMESAHHFSILSAVGAAAVYPLGAFNLASILCQKKNENQQEIFEKYCDNFQYAVEKAHLVTMAKYGIISSQVYYAARLVESITLNLTEFEEQYDQSCLGEIFNQVHYCQEFPGYFGIDDILTSSLKNHQKRYESELITSGRFAYISSGMNHIYNPFLITNLRDLTNQYQTFRNLHETYNQLAEKLKITLDLIDDKFIIKNYKEKLNEYNEQLKKEMKDQNQKIVELSSNNDILFNSLFYIDGIAKELEDLVIKTQEIKIKDVEELEEIQHSADQFTVNDNSISKFLSVIQKQTRDIESVYIQYREGQITFELFKQVLFEKAGYDPTQMDSIEAWSNLIKEEKVYLAAEIFKQLNTENQEAIKQIYEKHNNNQLEIETYRANIKSLKSQQTLNNILIEVSIMSSTKEIFIDKIQQKILYFKEKAQKNNIIPTLENNKFKIFEINSREVDKPFYEVMKKLTEYKKNHPVTISDYLDVNYSTSQPWSQQNLQPVSDIISNHFITGGMSHGALTIKAHNDISRANFLINGNQCTGEGGRPDNQTAKSIQIASGRFGINPEYFENIDSIEIKIGQGAKPGEGGMLPPGKVTVEIAAIRISVVGFGLVSPPPHHDIYSIEDFQQLIKDLKELKNGIKVGVKICSSEGIGQIAIGIAKSGADIINIAAGSGGTGAAAIDSIKSTGLPSEIGLILVNQYLTKAGIRNLVQLQVSGFPNTPEGVIIMAILGGDIFESGSTDIIMLGCDMHRKCNIPGACGPGITNNVQGYQGHCEDLALYKLNMAISVQNLLKQLNVSHLKDLRGRVDLLLVDRLKGKVSEQFIQSMLWDSSPFPQLPEEKLQIYRQRANKSSNIKEYQKLKEMNLYELINKEEQVILDVGELDVRNLSFGAGLVMELYQLLRNKNAQHLTINTKGVAGQSYGAFICHGIRLFHIGSVQDGFGKSMSGGVLVVKQPDSENHLTNSTYVGNAALYGACGGKAFIPSAGSRCAVLMKGATLVVNGQVGDYACEYMTSGIFIFQISSKLGSFLVLGKVGLHFSAGMTGGIAVLYDGDGYLENHPISDEVRYATQEEASEYHEAIKILLNESYESTQKKLIKIILDDFNFHKFQFRVVIPKTLDTINTIQKLSELITSFNLRYNVRKFGEQQGISIFEQVWFQAQKKVLSKQQKIISQVDLNYNDSIVEMCSKFQRKVILHQQHLKIYGPIATRIVLGIAKLDQNLSNDVSQLYSELFQHGKKCSCDAVTCTKSGNEKIQSKQINISEIGCPLGKNPNLINGILNDKSMLEFERAKKAFKLQIKESPFAGFTGFACSAPCQSSCTHSAGNKGNDEAVQIRRIELLLHRLGLIQGWYDEFNVFQIISTPSNRNKKVMIIGSGPAGLEAAFQLAKNDVNVEIYEKADRTGGLLRYGIPDHKLLKETIDFYVAKLKSMGIQFFLNSNINIDTLKIDYPGYSLYLDARGVAQYPLLFDQKFTHTNVDEGGNHILAMDFLTYSNHFTEDVINKNNKLDHPFKKFKLGEKVVVLGAGDTAEDVKRVITSLNAKLNHKPKYQVKLISINRQPILSDTAKIGSNFPYTREIRSEELHKIMNTKKIYGDYEHFDDTSPNKFIFDENGKIKAVHCNKTYVVTYEFARGFRDRPNQLGEFEIYCDSVIVAIGFKAPTLNYDSGNSLQGTIEDGSIIPIGDLATKSGFLNGQELIVTAQAIAKGIVEKYLGISQYKEKEVIRKKSSYSGIY